MENPNGDNSDRRIKSLERGFKIIEYLYDNDRVTVSELASELDISSSTAHIYLKTLHDLGYVLQDGKMYRLSLQFLRYGEYVRQRSKLYRISRSEINSLSEETNEVSALGIPENGSRVLLYKSEGAEAVYDNPPVGEYTHMHWTALGKAILTHFSRERVEEIIDSHGLPTRTRHTLENKSDLLDELDKIRDRGYALEDEERWDGIRSVAVPLFDNDVVIGAISLSGPKHRFDEERIETELLDQLTRAKNVIEVRLTHQ